MSERKDTVTILSPVHIGTGKNIEAPCFRRNAGKKEADCYEFLDVLTCIPSDKLIQPDFIESLIKNNPKKREQYARIKTYVNYQELNKKYTVIDKNIPREDMFSKDISEQIKDLSHPYIPGSSLKGALFHAWIYYELKKNYNEDNFVKLFEMPGFKLINEFYDAMDEYNELGKRNPKLRDVGKKVKDANKKYHKILDKYTFVNYILGETEKENIEKHSEFIKSLQGCISCDDIYFNDIEIFESARVKRNGDSNRKPNGDITEFVESIKMNQDSIGNPIVFQVDMFKYNLLKKKVENNEFKVNSDVLNKYRELLNDLNLDTVAKASNEFVKDVLEIEVTNYNFRNQVKGITNLIDNINKNNEKAFVIRIGKSTNYFMKSIAYLVKKKSRDLYLDYFDLVFSPNCTGPTKANAETVPSTQVIYSNGESQYLPGFIKVTYD